MAVHKKYNRNAKTNALGRGLDALISTEAVSTQGSSTINEIAIDQIEANPNQPRREFDPVALEELSNSIRELGLVQPITLRQIDDNRFQIIAGERRWRACQLAGLTAIPAYIRTIKDENVMELALVENIQREDLNAIEIALAYEHLQEKSGMTQEYLAEKADLGFNYIYRLENKQLNVKLETIEKIIQALEVDMNTFFNIENQNQSGEFSQLIEDIRNLPTEKREPTIKALRDLLKQIN